VETVHNFKFVSVYISEKLKLSNQTGTAVKKARPQLFNLRMLKRFGLLPRALTVFYRSTSKIVLSVCIPAWYGHSTAARCFRG
jgi:hypothetical protein